MDFKQNHCGSVGHITKAATFKSSFHLSYKNTQWLLLWQCFFFIMRQTLTDDFSGLHKSMHCMLPLNSENSKNFVTFMQNQYISRNCLKTRWGWGGVGLGQFADLRRGLAKKRWLVFLMEGNWYPNSYYAIIWIFLCRVPKTEFESPALNEFRFKLYLMLRLITSTFKPAKN